MIPIMMRKKRKHIHPVQGILENGLLHKINPVDDYGLSELFMIRENLSDIHYGLIILFESREYYWETRALERDERSFYNINFYKYEVLYKSFEERTYPFRKDITVRLHKDLTLLCLIFGTFEYIE